MNDEMIELESKARTPWKTITFGALILIGVGAYTGIHAANAGVMWWTKTKQELVLNEVIAELSKHPIDIDLKTKKLPPEVTREQLLKMVLVTHNRMSQCEVSIQLIKDTIAQDYR